MYKITDIQTLGTGYTVADMHGNVIRTIQVIPYSEILTAINGEYDISSSLLDEYLKKAVRSLSGYEGIKQYRVYWHADSSDTDLNSLIEYALINGYERIILEHVDKATE